MKIELTYTNGNEEVCEMPSEEIGEILVEMGAQIAECWTDDAGRVFFEFEATEQCAIDSAILWMEEPSVGGKN